MKYQKIPLFDKIKKIEILNFVKELKVDNKFILNLVRNKYSRFDINSIENFDQYIKDNNLNNKMVKEKFAIELIWNDLIFKNLIKKLRLINKK